MPDRQQWWFETAAGPSSPSPFSNAFPCESGAGSGQCRASDRERERRRSGLYILLYNTIHEPTDKSRNGRALDVGCKSPAQYMYGHACEAYQRPPAD